MPALTPLLALARPHQWAKGVFVLIGPAYGVASGTPATAQMAGAVAAALVAFSLAASACYVVNDLRDAPADRLHPRKKRRPIASGTVSLGTAKVFAGALLVGSAVAAAASALAGVGSTITLAVILALYVANTTAYSVSLKNHAVLDVMSLAMGFVLRVLAGCAATGVVPSAWLLNVTFFLAMFLAFGKRLGERRTFGSGESAPPPRPVQAAYTDELLRMAVVVTGVASLLTYAGYVQAQTSAQVGPGQSPALLAGSVHWLWFTMLPATYGLLRCIVLLERGTYDDPTELAIHDRPFQLAAVVFGALTAAAMVAGVFARRGGGG